MTEFILFGGEGEVGYITPFVFDVTSSAPIMMLSKSIKKQTAHQGNVSILCGYASATAIKLSVMFKRIPPPL
jgi:hypothetical protein